MAENSGPVADQYATARATLRDNVKWLAAGFAAVGAIMLSGTPFTGLGALPAGSGRFIFALLTLFAATFCAFFAWRVLYRVLGPDPSYVNVLRRDNEPKDMVGLTKQERWEYEQVRREFIAHHEELLPYQKEFLDDLEALTVKAWGKYKEATAEPAKTAYLELWRGYSNNEQTVRNWASFVRLHYRAQQGVRYAQWLGLGALVAIIGFVWAVNPEKEAASAKEADAGTVIFNESDRSREPEESTGVALAPVLFRSGKSALDSQAMLSIEHARNYLNEHAETSLLIMAHTDTVATAAFNAKLAADRAHAVHDSLIREGGIAASRIFLALLPETHLPRLTGQEMASADNRSVEFAVIRSPAVLRESEPELRTAGCARLKSWD